MALMGDPVLRAKLGINAQEHLTAHFYHTAVTRDVSIKSFGNYKKVIHIISTMPAEVPIKWLVGESKQQLELHSKVAARITKIVKVWRASDTNVVADLPAEFNGIPEVKHALVVRRNRTMAHVLDRKLGSKGEPNFVVVGDGHLRGQGNMLELLLQDGYQVRQL